MKVEAIPCAACKWWSNEPVIGEDGRTWAVQGHWMHDGCRFLVQEGRDRRKPLYKRSDTRYGAEGV